MPIHVIKVHSCYIITQDPVTHTVNTIQSLDDNYETAFGVSYPIVDVT